MIPDPPGLRVIDPNTIPGLLVRVLSVNFFIWADGGGYCSYGAVEVV